MDFLNKNPIQIFHFLKCSNMPSKSFLHPRVRLSDEFVHGILSRLFRLLLQFAHVSWKIKKFLKKSSFKVKKRILQYAIYHFGLHLFAVCIACFSLNLLVYFPHFSKILHFFSIFEFQKLPSGSKNTERSRHFAKIEIEWSQAT